MTAAFAGIAPTLEAAETVAVDAAGGELWGVVLPGARSRAAEIQGDAWFLIVSDQWQNKEEDALGAAIPASWPGCYAAGSGSDLLAMGAPVAYLAALLGVQQ